MIKLVFQNGHFRVIFIIAQVIRVTVGCEPQNRIPALIILSSQNFDAITNPQPFTCPFLWPRHCSKCFININLPNPHSNLLNIYYPCFTN